MGLDLKGERLDISIRKGADIVLSLDARRNLTGAVLRGSITTQAGALVVLFTPTITDAVNGKLTLSLARTALALIDAPASLLRDSVSLEWSLDSTVGGVRSPLFFGSVALSAEAGRSL